MGDFKRVERPAGSGQGGARHEDADEPCTRLLADNLNKARDESNERILALEEQQLSEQDEGRDHPGHVGENNRPFERHDDVEQAASN